MKPYIYIVVCLLQSIRTYSSDTTFTNRFYTQSDGLSSYNISDITRDKYGLIWIGTQDGLNVYDGNSFKIFNRHYVNSTNGSDVKRVVYDRAHNLIWATFSAGGVAAIDCRTHRIVSELTQKNIRVLPSTSNLMNLWVGNNGELLISTGKNFLSYNYDKKITTILFELSPSLLDDSAIKVVWDDTKYYYILQNQVGITCLSKENKKVVKKLPFNYIAVAREQFLNKVIQIDDKTYLATDRRIGYIDSSMKYHHLLTSNEQITAFGLDNHNQLWFSAGNTLKKHHWNSNDNTSIYFINKTALPNKQQLNFAIVFDEQNNLWMGGSEGLIFSDLLSPVFSRYGYDPILQKGLLHLYDILPSGSQMYVNDLNGLKSYNCLTKRIVVIDSSHYPYYIFKLANNEMIFNNENGFALIKGTRLDSLSIYKLHPELLKIKHRLLVSHVQMNDSLIVLAGEDFKGIILWNIKRHKVKEIFPNANQGWKDNAVNSMYKINDKELFICQDNYITRFHLDKGIILTISLTDYAKDTIRLFFDMQKIRQGYAILAYGYGLVVTDSLFNVIKIVNTLNGLSGNGVYRILKDAFGYLWITTNNGLTRVNPETYACHKYFDKDGLHGNSFEEMSATTTGNKLIVGGLEGFTIVNPANVVKSKHLTGLYFSAYELKFEKKDSILVDLELSELVLPNNIQQLRISLSATGFADAGKTTFRYKIKELHTQWIDLRNEHSISLLRPGYQTYHLQIQALNVDGEGSKIKEITLFFLPIWFETSWFKLLILALVIGFLYGMYRFRVNQIHKREEIRKQISNDLHDDIGSTLNGVKVFCNLALTSTHNSGYLIQVREGVQLAIISVRDIMWVLNDKLDTIDDLIIRFEAFARPLAEAKNILLKKYIDDNLLHHVLTKEEKRNLYLILKESFNNSIKYAECTFFSYSAVMPRPSKIVLTIQDDGKGFDASQPTYGNGLKNMQYRAKQIKYRFSVESFEKGTTINLQKM